MDDRFHVNLRVVGEDVEESFIRSKKYLPQEMVSVEGVEWIDPQLVVTPQRIWLGGMEYFDPNAPAQKEEPAR